MAITLLSDLVNPQVMADIVDKKLTDAMKFAPLADIDNTLAGKPGDTISLPSYSFIGSAAALGEASELTYVALQATTASVQVKKIAKGVEISDEAVLSGFGDPVGEAANQLALAIAAKLDDEVLGVLASITGDMLYETASTTTDPKDTDIAPALEKFGEDVDGVKVALVAPNIYTAMRANTNSWIPASEVAAEIAVKGIVGEYQGCQIMVTNKLKTPKNIYIVKPGALRVFLKRDTLVESARDLDHFCTKIAASKHFAAYLYDASKAIKIAKKSA